MNKSIKLILLIMLGVFVLKENTVYAWESATRETMLNVLSNGLPFADNLYYNYYKDTILKETTKKHEEFGDDSKNHYYHPFTTEGYAVNQIMEYYGKCISEAKEDSPDLAKTIGDMTHYLLDVLDPINTNKPNSGKNIYMDDYLKYYEKNLVQIKGSFIPDFIGAKPYEPFDAKVMESIVSDVYNEWYVELNKDLKSKDEKKLLNISQKSFQNAIVVVARIWAGIFMAKKTRGLTNEERKQWYKKTSEQKEESPKTEEEKDKTKQKTKEDLFKDLFQSVEDDAQKSDESPITTPVKDNNPISAITWDDYYIEDLEKENYQSDMYSVMPEDEVRVSIWKWYDESGKVMTDGYLVLPFIGEVEVVGYTLPQIKKKITKIVRVKTKQQLGVKYAIYNPIVTVQLRKFYVPPQASSQPQTPIVQVEEEPRVLVVGEVFRPGYYRAWDMATLWTRIGGATQKANLKKVILIREGKEIRINYDAFLTGKDVKTPNITLRDKDVIVVKEKMSDKILDGYNKFMQVFRMFFSLRTKSVGPIFK